MTLSNMDAFGFFFRVSVSGLAFEGGLGEANAVAGVETGGAA